ncbi:unknown [Bacillus thuringiensis phage MZTP02]|uniref:Uncharacterized protein n=1 Tax=Bacillus thuringiensis phage MZTP02 TaxID=311221 RepID=Q56AR6_9CAUD|nr:unknown [Bacillus thuringiensis phage MZTP02]
MAMHQGTILIGTALHLQSARLVHHQPGPAATKAAQGRLSEGLLEGIKSPQFPLDGQGQLTTRLTAPLRAHHQPEQGVIGMAAAMVSDRPLQGGRQGIEAAQQLLYRQCGQLGRRFQCGVEVIDIGLVMTAMVDLHGQCIDMGFQCVVGIVQGWQGMAHDDLCSD